MERDFGLKSINSDMEREERNNIKIGPNFIIGFKLLPRFAKSHHPPDTISNKVHITANFSTLIRCSETTLSG